MKSGTHENKEEKNSNETTFVDFGRLRRVFSIEQWQTVYCLSNPNGAFNEFLKTFKDLVSTSNKRHKNRGKNRHSVGRKSWITKGLLNSIRKKEGLYKTWVQDKTCLEKKLEHLRYNRLLKRTLNLAKNNCEREKVLNLGNDSRKIWEYVNTKLNRKPKKVMRLEDLMAELLRIKCRWRICSMSTIRRLA